MRDQEAIDAELRLVAALRREARERGVPLPSIGVAETLLEERRETHRVGYEHRALCEYAPDGCFLNYRGLVSAFV
jgi:hypothetical protein